MDTRKFLNEIYFPLVEKTDRLLAMLKRDSGYDCFYGFFNSHYQKDENGASTEKHFPIPVITVKGLCDIELDLQTITVTTKLKIEDALRFE